MEDTLLSPIEVNWADDASPSFASGATELKGKRAGKDEHPKAKRAIIGNSE